MEKRLPRIVALYAMTELPLAVVLGLRQLDMETPVVRDR